MLLENFKDIPHLFYLFIVFAFSITIHELSHAYVAYRFGDPTAKNAGRITLNPLSHLDLFGTIMILFANFGWAKPVPVNYNYFKNPKRGMIMVSLAGPLSNFILGFLFAFGYLFVMTYNGYSQNPGYGVYDLLFTGARINIVLGVFNFLPIPPLDGSKIFSGFLPTKLYYKIMENSQILLVVFLFFMFTGILNEHTSKIYTWIWGIYNSILIPFIDIIL